MGKKAAKQIDFARKHEEDLRRLRGLRLLDDDFMQKVFEDKACTELLLQIILNRTDLKVIHVNGQQDIKNSFIKVGIGAEKRSKVISEKDKKITAYHEAGHAILFHVLPILFLSRKMI